MKLVMETKRVCFHESDLDLLSFLIKFYKFMSGYLYFLNSLKDKKGMYRII